MKQQKNKKKALWICVVAAAVVLAVVGTVLGFVLLSGDQNATDSTGDGKLYWNVDRLYYTENSETGLSEREKEADGLYSVRFAVDGELVEKKVAGDARLINYMDTMDAMGLVTDADGVVVEILDPKTFVQELAKEYYVMSAEADRVVLNSSQALNGMELALDITENTGIYDVTEDAAVPGQIGECVLLDTVTAYGNSQGEVTHVFITSHPVDAKVYWRLERFYDTKAKTTTRVPDENGVYAIGFAYEGEHIELKCKDIELVNTIDKFEATACEVALELDDEGYIIGIANTATALRGKEVCYNFNITAINGNAVDAEAFFSNKRTGQTSSFNLDESTKIYLVDNGGTADKLGEPTQLQLDDRIIVYSDIDGKPILIFVTKRMVDSPMYFNISRKYKNGETTREKENGWYVFDMAADGAPVTVKTQDKEIASKIDSISSRAMGLKVNGGVVERVYDASCVCGWGLVATERYLQSLSGTVGTLVSSSNFENATNIILGSNTKVYDVTGNFGVKYGAETTLQLYDRATAFRDKTGQLSHVFVLSRYEEGSSVYYNVNRKYSSTKKETTRQPDDDGYYVFDMLCDGKEVTVKTKNKAMASFIDKQNAPIVALRVKNGIITNAYLAPTAVKYGYKDLNYNFVSKVNSDGTFNAYYVSNGVRKDRSATYKLAADCKIYNVSNGFISKKGEKTTLKKDDRIQVIATKPNGEIKVIWVVDREVDSPLYWKTEQKYNSTKKETTRQPDANGYYVFDLAVNGEIKQFKTNDKELASRVDGMGLAFALRTKGDIIEQVYGPLYAKGIKDMPVANFDVMAIDGRKVTVQRNRPEATDFGQTMELTFAKDCKIYNVSTYAEHFGAVAELGLGDRIACYTNADGEVEYCYIRNEHTRKAGSVSYCEHCQKEVFWEPYVSTIYETDAHYYLTHDRTLNKQLTLGSSDIQEKYDVVLDLNGFTLTSTKRSFLTYVDLSIMDSAGGGKIVSKNSGGGLGGNLMVSGKAVLNLYGGTFTLAEDAEYSVQGGVIYVATADAVLNMYGGTIQGGKVQSNESKSAEGGNIYVTRGTFNLYDGTISDGVAENGYGGNVFVRNDNAKFNMYGGTITGGQAKNGNNVYITGGTNAPATMTMTGGTITGDVVMTKTADVKLSGNPVITKGSVYGLKIPAGKKITLGLLKETTSVVISASGVFTEDTSNAATYQPYFIAADAGDFIAVEGKALAYKVLETGIDEDLKFAEGTNLAWCPVCKEKVEWTAITQADNGETPVGDLTVNCHYYLAENVTYTGTTQFLRAPSTGKTACVHLNGHNITAENARVFTGYAGTLNVMGTGTVSGSVSTENHGAAVHINTGGKNGQINLYSGTYTVNAGNEKAAVVTIWNNGGKISIYEDAKIVNNNGGNSIYVGKASLVDAQLAVYGAKVEGGNIRMIGADSAGNSAQLLLEGGQIDGVKLSGNNQVSVSGSLKIGKLVLAEGVKISVDQLKTDSEIFVQANGAFTEYNEGISTYAGCFKPATSISDIEEREGVLYSVKQYNNALVFAAGTQKAICPACEKEVTWKVLGADAAVKLADGDHYYLSDSVTYSGTDPLVTAPGKEASACLHLNGKDITATNARAIYGNAGTLNVMGVGRVSGNFYAASGSNSHRGAAVDLHNATGVLNLYGGTYVKPAANAVNPIITADSNGGTINLYKGAVVDGTGTTGVTVKSLYGLFCVRGGKVIAGNGAAMQATNWKAGVTGKLELYSGEVIGEVKLTGSTNDKAIFLWVGGSITGNVTVKNCDMTLGGDAKLAGEGNVVEIYTTTKLTVREDFTGTATVWFEGVTDSIPETNGISQGAYTGELVLKDSGAKVIGQDGKLVISN